MSKLKIAYLSYFDSSSVKHWSGSVYFIRKSLEDYGVDVLPIDMLGSPMDNIYKYKSLYYKAIGKKYQRPREIAIVKRSARIAEKKLSEINADFILSSGSLEISMLESKLKKAFWTDATFDQLVDYYPDYTNLASETIKNGNYLEKLSVEKSELQFFASDWAAKGSMDIYGSKPENICIAPFGANFLEAPRYEDIKANSENKSLDVINVLFVGVDWIRKGGDVVLKIVEKLNQNGRKALLHIAGCNPPFEVIPEYVKVYGFLRKGVSEEYNQLLKLFKEAHFFAMPSRSECFGIVFCEANAFGLPAIAANNGGMPTIIREERNGTMFDYSIANNEIERIAAYIDSSCQDRQKYLDISMSAYNEFKTRLNWESSAKMVVEKIKERV